MSFINYSEQMQRPQHSVSLQTPPKKRIISQKNATQYNSMELTSLQILHAQIHLKQAGFDPGPLDGILGPKTKSAICRYQIKHGLIVNGRIDEETYKCLHIIFSD